MPEIKMAGKRSNKTRDCKEILSLFHVLSSYLS